MLVSCHDESINGGRIFHSAVSACLFPALAADGCHVTTVKGVGSWRRKYSGLTCAGSEDDGTIVDASERREDHLHPVQRAMVDFHGSQCGFCTPGIVVALYSLFTDDRDEGTKAADLEE